MQSDPRITRLVQFLNQTPRLFPPLEKLLFRALCLVLLVEAIVRLLRSH